MSGLQASAITYLGEFHSNENRPRFVTLTAMFMPLGTAFQPFLALLIMPMEWRFNFLGLVYAPWRLYMLLSSSIMIFSFISMMRLPESPKFLLSVGKKSEAMEVLRTLYSINKGVPKAVRHILCVCV